MNMCFYNSLSGRRRAGDTERQQTDRQVDGCVYTVCKLSACAHARVYMFAMVMLQPLMRAPDLPSLLRDNRCLVQTSWRQSDHMTGSC